MSATIQSNGFIHLSSLISTEHIVPEMTAHDRLGAISELVRHMSDQELLTSSAAEETVTALRSREEFISTGIGSGVAIPHAFSDHVSRVVAVLGRSHGGIDFSAHDDAPVHLVILFVVPRHQHHLHLRTLAAIGRLFHDEEMKSRLFSAVTADEMLHLLRRRSSRAVAA